VTDPTGAAPTDAAPTGAAPAGAEEAAGPLWPLDFWLRLADTLLNEHFADLLEEHGLTRREWELLRLLSRAPGTEQDLDAALASFLATNPFAPDDDGSSTDGLAELAESRWLERDGSSYRLTPRGVAAYERLQAAFARRAEAVGAGISREDFRTTVQVLRRLAANLGWPASSGSG
jgi:DNA-binding MarR family transcriptional regulator